MITLAKIAQQVIRRASGGNQSKDSQLDRREVMLRIRQVMNEECKKSFFENYNLGEPGVEGQYVARYTNVAVLKDTTTNEEYSNIPSTYAALPNGRGIREVVPVKSGCFPLIIRKHGSKGIYSRLDVANMQGALGCWPEGNKLYYDQSLLKQGIQKVTIKLAVAAPDSVGEDDDLPIDESAATAIVDKTFQFFYPPVPQDRINNNNPNS